MVGIFIGSIFSGVTAYIGLKIGLAVSAAWYVACLLYTSDAADEEDGMLLICLEWR